MGDESDFIDDACSRFEAAWQSGQQPRIEDYLPAESPEGATLRDLLVSLVGIDLEWRWKTAGMPDLQEAGAKEPDSSFSFPLQPRLADYVARYPLLGPVEQLPCELIVNEYDARRCYGDRPTRAEYLDAFGAFHPELASQLQSIDDGVVSDLLDPSSKSLPETRLWQPEIESRKTGDDTTPNQPQQAPEESVGHPDRIGRYRIEQVLGVGAFSTVYRGYDDTLKRPVAIKVPHRHLVEKPEDIDLYLEEAQVVASLDHANIVPVHDVGRTEDGLCYVVSKLIEGKDLAKRIKENRLSHCESAGLVAAIAEALHHAHQHMVVHRDVKPANILIEATGKPYLADFGLALKEEGFGSGPGVAGTAAYMSPEQARGEGHLVDGRADIFSLGVVFYELLTASRPFWGANREEVIERIRSLEVRPPRQLDDSIPKELERICLKSLSKRASDRYTTALDMAEDLRRWLRQQAPEVKPCPADPQPSEILPNLEDAVSDKGILTQTATREIELTIDTNFDSYDDRSLRLLLAGIGKLLEIPETAVRLINKRRGSVLLNLSLPADAAERLHWAIKAGELRQYGVVASRLSDLPPMSPENGLFPCEIAETEVYERYRERLCQLVEREMNRRFHRQEDPEDVVQSAFRTFFRRNAQGEFHFEHTSELWRLLEAVTRHKIIKHAESQKSKKRTPKAEEYEDAAALLGREPTVDEQTVAKDLIDQLLRNLDESYSKIALLLRERRTERAIAEQLGCSRAAVRTKIGRLRKRLQAMLEEDSGDRVE